MAVLSKDDFMSAIKGRIGDDNSDESLAFLENMTDTYNDLFTKANGDGEDWKTRYEENDKQWRERYKERFYSETENTDPVPKLKEETKTEEQEKAENISINDLFTDKKE